MMFSNLLTNHRLPSGAVVIAMGSFGPVTGPNILKFPASSIRPIWSAMPSQNQSAPSGPSVMSVGRPLDGIEKKVMIAVAGSSLTMELLFESVNQISPSAVVAIPLGVNLHGWLRPQSRATRAHSPPV